MQREATRARGLERRARAASSSVCLPSLAVGIRASLLGAQTRQPRRSMFSLAGVRRGNLQGAAQDGFEHLVGSVRMVAVDCASDEINSVRDMKTPADGSAALAPNLEMIGRDKAHGSRRGITRPWTADDTLKDLLERFVHGKHSMIQKLDRSNDLRRMFTKYCGEMDSGFHVNANLLVSLRSAKHRFESLASPLGMWVVRYQAIVMTCREII